MELEPLEALQAGSDVGNERGEDIQMSICCTVGFSVLKFQGDTKLLSVESQTGTTIVQWKMLTSIAGYETSLVAV